MLSFQEKYKKRKYIASIFLKINEIIKNIYRLLTSKIFVFVYINIISKKGLIKKYDY